MKAPHVLVLPLLLLACSPQKPACSPQSLATLEAQYVAEAVSACKAEGSDYQSCKALAEIRAEYKARREAYVACR